MKIRIRENQYSLIEAHQIEANILEYVAEMTKIGEVINKYYNKLTFITIAEVLSGEINISNLTTELMNLDSRLNKINMVAVNHMDKSSHEEFDKHGNDVDLKLDSEFSRVSSKIDALISMLESLDSIVTLELEKGFSTMFSDEQPLDI